MKNDMQKIMFNDRFLLTQAVLEGRKTQTRRFPSARSIDEYDDLQEMYEMVKSSDIGPCTIVSIRDFLLDRSLCIIGEIVAVAQSYENAGIDPYYKIYNKRTKEYDNACDTAGWTNKMFVKAELMPHHIKITNVRLERLQDISDDECLLEGIEKEERTDGEYNYIFFDVRRELYIRERTPRDAYARLIDAISGKGTWYSNPYVFVYDFELVK